MNVRFEFTIADLLDVTDRSLLRQPSVRRTWLQDRLVFAVCAGGGVYLLLIHGRESSVLSWAGIGAVVAAELFLSRLWRRAKLRRWLREEFGGEGPFTCEARIDAGGLHVTQLGATRSRAWTEIGSIVDASWGIEFVSTAGTVMCIRNRAFATDAHRCDYLSAARNFHSLAAAGDARAAAAN